ncbi:hypothetical protein BO99DRAFT_468445 [Aspergillus violaceofuscus CBS 115571]|uniref:Uncharacterized protein n=1 Tax=Aspergillus violaceofuscus (strain CBS 115571) TaxID=1450538 RepID=A0A2V5HEB1_ASPV1|nr:hypothetical protein BO99DRAFT_468445 [Aspergillus violaceofuscus CBS 115571]
MAGLPSTLGGLPQRVDFVVATTQASINSHLVEYLAEGTQPVEYICYLADPDTGNPTVPITLEELKQKTGGHDPFYIEEGTPFTDERVQAMYDVDFAVGIKMQIGLPPGVDPKTLSVVELGESASSVKFNLYCAQLTVIELTVGRHNTGKWNVWSQPSGQPWTIQTRVDLVVADLDDKLDTPYFNQPSHHVERDRLRNALTNLSGTAFSLQQLMFDLDNTSMQELPTFPGMDMKSSAGYVLGSVFLDKYWASAHSHGLPLVSVTAVTRPEEESPMHITAFERIVSPARDFYGRRIKNPDLAQQAVTTLDHLCVINNRPCPSADSRLGWSWVQPENVSQQSGIMAMSVVTLRDLIAEKITPQVSANCYRLEIDSENKRLDLVGSQTPQISAKNGLIQFDYYSDVKKVMSFPSQGRTAKLAVQPEFEYWCIVDYDNNPQGSIVVKQGLNFTNWMMEVDGDVFVEPVGVSGDTIAYLRLTTTYTVEVSQKGDLQLVKSSEKLEDFNKDSNWSGHWDSESARAKFHNTYVAPLEEQLKQFHVGELHELQLGLAHNLVFPGGRVFTYKNPTFDHGALVCEITYVESTEVSKTEAEAEAEAEAPQPPEAALLAPPPPLRDVPGKLTASTELMQNYLHGEIVSPTDKFEALQTADGHTLLFAVDTSGVFHVIEEQSGTGHTGWEVRDLSTALIQAQFPSSDAVVQTFEVGQRVEDGNIGMLMVVRHQNRDHLFLAPDCSNQDTSWAANPTWTAVPFDATNEYRGQITVVNAFFAATWEQIGYVVVDLSSGSSTDPHITRYHIEESDSTGDNTSGFHWVKHDVTVDIEAGQYQSAVGRVAGKHGDGIYTAGTVAGQPQFVYEPIVNYYGAGPASPRRLQLPSGLDAQNAIPSAIATARQLDGSTDLYAVGGSTIYRLAADEQEAEFTPTAIATSPVLAGTDTLRAMVHDGVTTLWGRNASNQVYYLACAKEDELDRPRAWSAPIPILFNIERMSPYVNRTDGGNTIFATGNNGRIQKVVQGSASTGKTWRAQDIVLAAGVPQQKATSFKSYTTTIHATQLGGDLPAANTIVQLSANSRVPVYVNGVYYVLSAAPVEVPTDATGALTVVEATDSLHASVLTAKLTNTSLTINPMDHTFDKLAALNSADKLRAAAFPSQTVAGGVVGSPDSTSLVDASIDDATVQAVAQHLDVLKAAYRNLSPTSGTKVGEGIVNTVGNVIHTVGDVAEAVGKAVTTAAGDVLQWVKHEVKSVGRIIHDTVTGTLHLVAQIGSKVYHAVLDTAHAVVGAVQWVFDKVKTGIEKLIQFVEMLFHWDDIRRCKDVMHNTIKLYLQNEVEYIRTARDFLDREIGKAQQSLNQWSGITNWSGLGDTSTKVVTASASNPHKDQTSASKFLANHYQNNASQMTVVGDHPTMDAVEQLLSDLIQAIAQEGHVLEGVYKELVQLAHDFSSLSVEAILRRVVGILADGVLSSVQVVVDAVLNLLYDVAEVAIALLDTKIHIPVVSDILNAVGVPDISLLDLLCWIAAVSFTVVYKVAYQHAPFPAHDPAVQTIVSASHWKTVAEDFQRSDHSLKRPTFQGFHGTSALMALIGNPLNEIDAMSEAGSGGFLSKATSVFKVVISVSQTVADELVPQDPLQNGSIKTISHVTSALGLLCSLYFSGLGQKAVGKIGVGSMSAKSTRGIGALVGVMLIPFKLVTSGFHFFELSQDGAGDMRSAAILGEVSNLTSYASRIAYAVVVNDEDPETRAVAVTVKAFCDQAYAGLQVAETAAGYL